MSQDAWVVLISFGMLVCVTFIIAVIISYIMRSAAVLAEKNAEKNAADDKVRAFYHGRKYAIEVIFFDRAATTIQYENVIDHTYRDGMIIIRFSGKYAVYIPVGNVKRMIVRPMLQEANYDDCDEYEIEPEEIKVHMWDGSEFGLVRDNPR